MWNESKILLVRTDKIGDVVLTTPAISALRKRFPGVHLAGLVSPVAAEIYRLNPHLNQTIVIDPSIYSGFFGFWRLVKRLRAEKFDAVVVFQTTASIGIAILFTGIPIRIGPLSKFWSWFCFNQGRRQYRSAVEMHEAEYNIQLLKFFGITVLSTRERTHLLSDANARENARKFFREKGLGDKFRKVAIHPGMAGSALNWPEHNYVALAKLLIQKYHVIVTGGPSEAALVDRVFQGIASYQGYDPDRPTFTKYVGERGLGESIALLAECDAVVAPSTGPMHMAVALGKKVVTIFPPIKVQSAMRWGPYGVSHGTNLGLLPEDTASVLVPDVTCGEEFRCALSACIYYPCMPRVSVEDVETQVTALVEGGSISMFKSTALPSLEWEELEGED